MHLRGLHVFFLAWQLLSSYCWIMSHCKGVSQFISPFTDWRIPWWLPGFGDYVATKLLQVLCMWKFLTPLGKHLGPQLLKDMVGLHLALAETIKLFPRWKTMLHYFKRWMRVLTTPPPCGQLLLSILFCQFRFVDSSHFNRCAMAAHHWFNFHFLNDIWGWRSFHMLVCHIYVFLGKISLQIFCTLLIGLLVFLLLSWRVLCIFWTEFFIKYGFCTYFSPACVLVFQSPNS